MFSGFVVVGLLRGLRLSGHLTARIPIPKRKKINFEFVTKCVSAGGGPAATQFTYFINLRGVGRVENLEIFGFFNTYFDYVFL